MSDPFNKAYTNTGSFLKAVEEHKKGEPQRKKDAQQKKLMNTPLTDFNQAFKTVTGKGTGSGVGMGTGSGVGMGKEHGTAIAKHLMGKGHKLTEAQAKKLLKHAMAKYKKHFGIK
jgi:hypothetical protein